MTGSIQFSEKRIRFTGKNRTRKRTGSSDTSTMGMNTTIPQTADEVVLVDSSKGGKQVGKSRKKD